ncbi:unnamed protein product [Adineta ricciae]|uniref:G-protein coupled receptors family 1 profile domain-containing protein n=1 Tax=Adineta ricciae TaxID=249248 RepID=A0A816B9H0_ADIRI|nr:unnamed protein product [Adineta ricciae]CAF1607196.1 unnamed protein product [Adineta ricciae]
MNTTNYTTNNGDEFSHKLVFIQGLVYIPILCTGIVNNLFTIIVMLSNREMYTVTNCYLLNLAISDTLPLIISLPFEITFLRIKLPWNEIGCKLRSLLAETSTNASILTISAFTIERYLAVCRPLHTSYHSTTRRAIKIEFLIWFIAVTSSIPYFHFIERADNDCVFNTDLRSSIQICFHISAIVFFVLPAFILCFLYALMAQRLYSVGLINRIRWSKSSGTESCSSPRCLQKIECDNVNSKCQRHSSTSSILIRHSSILRSNKSSLPGSINPTPSMKISAFKMLFAVVIAFIICYAPFHVQRLITSSLDDNHLTTIQQRAITIFFSISGILYFLGASINPIFYHLYSRRYRQACRRTIRRILHCQQQYHHHRHHYHHHRNHSFRQIQYRKTEQLQPFTRLVACANSDSIVLPKIAAIDRLAPKYRSSCDLSIKTQHRWSCSLPDLNINPVNS